MKTSTLCLLLGLSLHAAAQTTDSLATLKQIDSLLNQVARPLMDRQQLDEAGTAVESARQKAGAVLGRNHGVYATCLIYQGKILQKQENFAGAEAAFLEALTIQEKALGRDHRNYTVTLSNLSILYMMTGAYAKAEPLLLENKEIRARTLGAGHPDYARAVGSLGNLYYLRGDYGPAELQFREALAIYAQTVGRQNHDYAGTSANLASIYMLLGDPDRAEPLAVETKESYGALVGRQHPLYLQALDVLAGVYKRQGDADRAEPLFLEALSTYAAIQRRESTGYAHTANNLAGIYLERGDPARAEPLVGEAIDIYGRILGRQHPDYARALLRLARLEAATGRYALAEGRMQEVLAIQETSLGRDHPDYAPTLGYLATLYRQTGRPDQAAALLVEATTRNRRLIEKASGYSSEQEMATYLQTFQDQNAALYALGWNRSDAALAATAYDNALFYKGFLLNASLQVKNRARTDPAAAAKFESLAAYRRRLAAAYALPLAERDSAGLAELEEKANMLEKDLVRTVAGLGEVLRQVRWQEVQARLAPGSVAVEFLDFQNPDLHGRPTDTTLYIALVLRPGSPGPVFVPLFEERALTALLTGASGGNVRRINALYAAGGPRSLYDLIWKKLEGPLSGATTIYCAKSGLLHRINLGAIAVNKRETLADRHQLVVLGSTRQLVTSAPVAPRSNAEAYLVGGVRYAPTKAVLSYLPPEKAASASPFPADSLTRGKSWVYLPGTAAEVFDLLPLLKAARIQVSLDTGYSATEEAVKQVGRRNSAGTPRVLHFATHGYFFPDPPGAMAGDGREPGFKTAGDPLLRSGLILAGAQEVWTTGQPPAGREDGVLTAAEIIRMNLTGTELVVLSACETGLGDLRGTEGVYGLQRAFKIAGARHVVMSLWKVNDLTTREFMLDFYAQWLRQGLSLPDAFRQAQRQMQAKYPADPYHWAGFVLVE